MILDPTAESDKVSALLKSMQNKMDEFQRQAFQYKNYQKGFKVEITKYEELEEVHAEIRLKQLLWDSMGEWNTTVDTWLAVGFIYIPGILYIIMYKQCILAKRLKYPIFYNILIFPGITL